ncbi:major facilitator superfamily domain-containing protein [Mycotypha africana]|uniref:major facilitator superfamily domain-containing protein n=1 Tax=Mycotypha africana TaxID=64632 RepID=UPI002301BC8B|nr:major facilitator superfamily domain-containing protein [Mycotypha africana]KAI8973270.1 major facilitator superfamily domain-containing protein [Mycotypha africana]
MKHRKWPMVAGILGLLVSTFLFLFAQAYWELLLARFLQGFSDSCVWTLGMCLIADSFPLNELGSKMGIVLFFHSCGLVLGAPIGGTLFHNIGYKAPFILCICLAGLDFILRLFLVERRNQPPEWYNDSNETSAVEPSTIVNPAPDSTKEKVKERITILKLLRQNRLIASLVIAFSNGCVFNVFEPTLPVRLSSEWGYNSSQIGAVLLAQAIPTFVASPLAGYITDRYGAKVVAFSTVLICAVSTMLIGIPNQNTTGGIAPLIVLLVIQGFSAFACITPVLPEIAIVVQSLNGDDGDDGQGMSYALFNIAFGLGALVGPLFG